jgi:glycosyltransferase involved in cell wall biosynthesis
MKIAVFSINPIYPKIVTGGASKHLYHITRQLGARGHSIEIYCAQTEESKEPFTWSKNVLVCPNLPFDLPFPQPYALSGPDLALITERLSMGVNNADRFYIHDGEWLIPDIYTDIPTITSFRDNIYPESVLGTFITKADEVICVSPYSAAVIKNTAGRFFPALNQRIHQVNNGIDFSQFRHRDSTALAREFGLDLDRDEILLHPHRPERGKGLFETVHIANKLVHQHGLSNLKVLVPAWVEEMVSEEEKAFYSEILTLMQDLDVEENFIFFPWLPNDRMPELYSLADVTLCMGTIVEAFGNVAYESLACGTPSIVANVGVHRTMMPDDLITKVHPGDIESAVQCALEIFDQDVFVSKEATDFIHSHMDFRQQIDDYVRIIENCSKRERIQFGEKSNTDQQNFTLAPWCYFNGTRIYHDFHSKFEEEPDLCELANDHEVITYDLAIESGVSQSTWESWIARSFIVNH